MRNPLGLSGPGRFDTLARRAAWRGRACLLGGALALGTVMPFGSGAAQTLQARRDLRIDGNVHDLSFVTFATTAHDGTIAVAQPDDGRVLFFSPSGRAIGRYGRQGAGPEEFTRMTRSHGFVEGELWVGDLGRAHRIRMPELRGTMVPISPPVSVDGASIGAGIPFATQLLSGARVITKRLVPESIVLPTGWRQRLGTDEEAYVLASVEGRNPLLIAGRPGTRRECGTSPVERINCGATFVTSAGPDGHPFVIATWDDHGAGRASLRVVALKATGDTLFRRTLPVTRRAIPERTLDSLRALGARSSGDARLREYFSPLSGTGFVGHDGAIWIGLRTIAPGQSWLVLHPDGGDFGRLTVPENVWLTAGSFTQAWGVEEDADGMHHIVRYRISR